MRVQKVFTQPSRTKPEFKNECDINVLMARFQRTGDPAILNRLNSYTNGRYGDFSNIPDYRSALDQVKRADAIFMSLPAQVRQKFENNTAYFLDFCQNPDNVGALEAMGLIQKSPSQDAQEIPQASSSVSQETT